MQKNGGAGTETTQNGAVKIMEEEDTDIISLVDENDIISINVCGMVYETLKSTLARFPATLLGDKVKRKRWYLASRNMLFFDRNRQAFEAILYYYQTGGILIRPPSVPMVLFAEEIAFFELGEEACLQVQMDEGYIQEANRELPKNATLRKIWQLFECPDTSQAARLLALWSVFVIVLSITVFCIETLPQFRKESDEEPWFSLELGCICWFTFEYVARFISSPSKWKFAKSFMNIIDLLAILPYFITLSLNSNKSAPLSVLRVVRLVRVFRIFKLSRHSLGLRILGHTLKASVSELGMLIFFLILGVIVFSSAIFYCEEGVNKEFISIPDAFWYSLVTMTTVGYGDKYPVTLPGKIVGSMCALVGVLTIALPVPVIVSNFEFFYKRDRLNYESHKNLIDSPVNRSRASSMQPLPTPDPARKPMLMMGTPDSGRKILGSMESVRKSSNLNVSKEFLQGVSAESKI